MSRPAMRLLVAELTVSDPELMLRYAREVQPRMARYGGRAQLD